ASAQHDVEAEAERPIGNGVVQVEHRDHASARLLVGDRIEDGIEREEAVTWKIHLRDKTRQERVAEHREVDVVRPPRVVVIAPRMGARFHRDETIVTLLVADRPPSSGKVRIERPRMMADIVDVAPAAIRLPYLDERVGNRTLVLIV